MDEEMTSGTSDFEESTVNEPDDCYCESFDLERLSPDILLRPADKYYLDNIIEWKMQTILEGYPNEQPPPEEYNKISNYVKNETPKMLDDTRIIMYNNDQPIGMIIAYQKEQDWFIDDIFLIPEFRHKGIGRMILENEISSHDQLALWVYKSNIHAISLYESLGFKVEESIKERQMMRLRKTDVELIKGWRVTYQGIGIYEALKNAMFEQTGSSNAWISFINSDACNWLPKPPSYGNDNKSFFTEKGFNRFDKLVLPIIAQYIDQTKIYIEEIMVPTNQIVYSDEFQFVISDTMQESAIPRSNAVYTTGQLTKIEDFPFDKAYFGSPNKLPSTMKLDGPFFITPYIGTASIFAIRPQHLQKYGVPRGISINRAYKEWDINLKDTLLQEPLEEVHVILQGAPDIKESVENASGYIYTIDITPDIRNHIYQSDKMDKDMEFCIDKLDTIDFSNIQEVTVKMTVSGAPVGIKDICISYAMGVDNSIYELTKEGFRINEDDGDYEVMFDYSKKDIWEEYINTHIKDTYWNEYINLSTKETVFMIKENNQIKRVVNHNFENDIELLSTCNRLCEGNFGSIKELILSNDFYKRILTRNNIIQESAYYQEASNKTKLTREKNKIKNDLNVDKNGFGKIIDKETNKEIVVKLSFDFNKPTHVAGSKFDKSTHSFYVPMNINPNDLDRGHGFTKYLHEKNHIIQDLHKMKENVYENNIQKTNIKYTRDDDIADEKLVKAFINKHRNDLLGKHSKDPEEYLADLHTARKRGFNETIKTLDDMVYYDSKSKNKSIKNNLAILKRESEKISEKEYDNEKIKGLMKITNEMLKEHKAKLNYYETMQLEANKSDIECEKDAVKMLEKILASFDDFKKYVIKGTSLKQYEKLIEEYNNDLKMRILFLRDMKKIDNRNSHISEGFIEYRNKYDDPLDELLNIYNYKTYVESYNLMNSLYSDIDYQIKYLFQEYNINEDIIDDIMNYMILEYFENEEGV